MTWAKLSTEGVMSFHDGVPSSDQLHEAVGGYFEIVEIPGLGDMWLNEEGKLDGLPRNEKATWITTEGPRGAAGLAPWDYIAGNVAFTGGADDEGETIGLSEAAVAWLQDFDRRKKVITFGPEGAKIA